MSFPSARLAAFCASISLSLTVSSMMAGAPLAGWKPPTPSPAVRSIAPDRLILPVGRTWDRKRVSTLQVTVPKGVTQVVMEQRQGTGWKPVKVEHLTFGLRESVKVLPVILPPGVTLAQIRMVGYRGAKFPAGIATVPSQFERLESIESLFMPAIGIDIGGWIRLQDSILTLTGTVATAFNNTITTDTLTAGQLPSSQPTAVESDIWKIAGNQLFFFNQYRGLQVFDMTHPESPVRTGTVRLAASGEQMFVLNEDATMIGLLGRSNSRERLGAATLFLVKVTRGVPALLAELALSGPVLDSRLIGTKLYLLSHPGRYSSNSANQDPSTNATLQTVDLSDLAAPVLLGELSLGASTTSYLQASGDYLLVSTRSIGQPTTMHLVDPSTEDGVPVLVKSFPLKGEIQDKFKMGIVNGAAVAVTSTGVGIRPVRRWFGITVFLARLESGATMPALQDQRQTWVETFPIVGAETAPLAQMELVGARNETLHATRFDGNRLYVVTLLVRILTDPLFVVDLANPAQPAVLGSLEIPGWSTYLEPMGERLLAVGVEGNHVAVSLFDVADAAAPALLSRLLLGETEASSSSEATSNEKAVEFFAEEGLVLVPFQTGTGGVTEDAIQAIEVGRDSLTLGITIPHDGRARRGAVMGEHLVSISGQEMLVLDRTASTSAPEAELSLAWRVDRVLPFGSYLLQLTDGGAAAPHTSRAAMLRVTRSDDPDSVVEEIEFGPGRIIGTARQGDRLFVAQWVAGEGGVRSRVRTWVLDLNAPPVVRQITSVEHVMAPADSPNLFLYEVVGLWPRADTLVWHVRTPAMRSIGFDNMVGGPSLTLRPTEGIDSVRVDSAVPPSSIMMLCPVLRPMSRPAAGAIVRVGTSQLVRSASEAFADGGFIFSSYDETAPFTGMWITHGSRPVTVRSWLVVVDFNAPAPIVRDPVSIPGDLRAISQVEARGAILLTNAAQFSRASQVVHACAYDGRTVFQLDSRNLEVPAGNAIASDHGHLYLARGGEGPGVVGLGFDRATGHLTELGTWNTERQPAMLSVVSHHLLASSDALLETAALSADGSLTPGATFDTPDNLWLRVNRAVANATGLWIPADDYGVEFLPWEQLLP